MSSEPTDRRGNPPADPTAERTSDPVPTGDDVVARENLRRGDTPRRYEEDLDREDRTAEDDPTLKTQI